MVFASRWSMLGATAVPPVAIVAAGWLTSLDEARAGLAEVGEGIRRHGRLGARRDAAQHVPPFLQVRLVTGLGFDRSVFVAVQDTGPGMSADEISAVFKDWNKGELDSFLIEITGNILAKKDDDGTAIVDKILDAATRSDAQALIAHGQFLQANQCRCGQVCDMRAHPRQIVCLQVVDRSRQTDRLGRVWCAGFEFLRHLGPGARLKLHRLDH